MGHGIIVINPYLIPEQSVSQANRLKHEFALLGVSVEIITNTFLQSVIEDGKIYTQFNNIDFAIYLDKDKYQSEILTNLGIRLFNSHESIRVCDDKGSTYIALTKGGINTPKTIFAPLCYNKDMPIKKEWAQQIGQQLGFPLIVKQSFGSMGKGVYKADNLTELLNLMQQLKLTPHLYQQYLDAVKGVDIRVIVIGGKAVCAMERRNVNDFRSNIAQGGSGYKIQLQKEFAQVAQECAKILGLDYCGVDLLYDKDNKPCVCEVNSNAFFDGIESTTGFNVAKCYAQHIIKTIY